MDDAAKKLEQARWLLGIAINHYPHEPKAQTLFYEPPTKKQLIETALEFGLVHYDEWHHAPACPANNWTRAALPQGPCTCGAAKRQIK